MYSRIAHIVVAVGVVSFLSCSNAYTQSTAGTYAVLPTHSSVGFSIVKWMVFRETGRFKEFTGTIRHDPQTPSRSSVVFEVRAESVDTGIAMRDSVLRSDDFFDVARYPTLSFRSVEVQAQTASSLLVTGDLTIRGTAQRITILVTVLGANTVEGVGDIAGFETRFTIDRTTSGVTGTRWSGGRLSLSREVDIELRVAGRTHQGTD